MRHASRQSASPARVVELGEISADGVLIVHPKRRVPVVRDAHHKHAVRIATSQRNGTFEKRRKLWTVGFNGEALILVVHANQEGHQVPLRGVDLSSIHACIEVGSGPSRGRDDGGIEHGMILIQSYPQAVDQLVGPALRFQDAFSNGVAVSERQIPHVRHVPFETVIPVGQRLVLVVTGGELKNGPGGPNEGGSKHATQGRTKPGIHGARCTLGLLSTRRGSAGAEQRLNANESP